MLSMIKVTGCCRKLIFSKLRKIKFLYRSFKHPVLKTLNEESSIGQH